MSQRTKQESNANTTKKTIGGSTTDRAQKMRWWQPVLIVGAVIAAYATSLPGAFVFDDIRHIVNNQHIRDLSNLSAILSDHRPVVELTLALNYAIGGVNTAGYHVFNVLVHALSALVLFGLIRRTLLLPRFSGILQRYSGMIATACALVWAVHPLTTQSVTYIIQRGESMMALCYLLAIYCLLRGASGARSIAWYLGAVVALALGMGCKSVIVTAPVVALLYDRAFLSGTFAKALRARWMLHAALFATVIVIAALGIGQSVFQTTAEARAYTPAVGFAVQGLTWQEYALTQPGVILHYLRLSVAPLGLVLDYRWPFVDRIEPADAAAIVVVGVLGAAVLFGLWRNRWWGFVGAAFFIILAPTSSFIPIRDAAFEHRMYLPLAALVTLAVAGLTGLALRRIEWDETGDGRVRVVSGIVAVVALALATLTALRNLDYSSELEMWRDVASKRPNNDRALINVIAAMPDDSEPDEEVLSILQRALEVQPNHADARFRLGFALIRLDRRDEGLREIDRALSTGQATANTWLQWGRALAEEELPDRARAAFEKAKRLAPADQRVVDELARLDAAAAGSGASVEQLQDLAQRNPDRFEDQFNLGVQLNAQRKYSQAVGPLERAVAIRRSAPALYALAFSYEKTERVEEAEALYSEALELAPASLEIAINLANVIEQRGDVEGAIEALEKAASVVQPAPTKEMRARVYFNLGNIFARQRRLTESIEAYLESVDLDPKNAAAFYGLGWAFYNAQMLDDSIAALRESVELNPNDDRAQALLMRVFQERGQMPQANDPIPDWETRAPKQNSEQP